MAIMQKCCWFSNVRTGSKACGVYSLITSIIYLIVWSNELAGYVAVVIEYDITGPLADGVYAALGIDIIVLVPLLITSIVLLIGISYDSKAMLIPYMVAITAVMAFQAIAWIIIFALLGLNSVLLIGSFVSWILFTGLNITCLLCVISQYQELQAGRGTAEAA